MAASGFHMDRLRLKLCSAAMKIATLMMMILFAAIKRVFLQNFFYHYFVQTMAFYGPDIPRQMPEKD
jgi:hypothetical protein